MRARRLMRLTGERSKVLLDWGEGGNSLTCLFGRFNVTLPLSLWCRCTAVLNSCAGQAKGQPRGLDQGFDCCVLACAGLGTCLRNMDPKAGRNQTLSAADRADLDGLTHAQMLAELKVSTSPVLDAASDMLLLCLSTCRSGCAHGTPRIFHLSWLSSELDHCSLSFTVCSVSLSKLHYVLCFPVEHWKGKL